MVEKNFVMETQVMKFERFGFTDRRRQSSWNKDGHWRIYRFEVCYLEMRAQLTIWNNRFSTRDRRHTLTESIYAKILERLPFVVSGRIKKGKNKENLVKHNGDRLHGEISLVGEEKELETY